MLEESSKEGDRLGIRLGGLWECTNRLVSYVTTALAEQPDCIGKRIERTKGIHSLLVNCKLVAEVPLV